MRNENIQNLFREFKANQQIFKVLESSKSLTDGIFDELPVSLILIDQNRKVLKFNVQATQIFLKQEADMLGVPLTELFDDESQAQLDKYFDDKSHHNLNFEQRINSGSKTQVILWHLCKVFENKSQQFVHALLGSDITEARDALESVVVLKKDLELASVVQNTLLPLDSAYENSDCKIVGYYEPAAQVGGDLWLLHKFPNASMATIIDVMGHGAGSAMVTSLVSGAFEALCRKLDPTKEADVLAAMRSLNEIIISTCKNSYMVCIMSIVVEQGCPDAVLYSAGIPPASLFSKGTSENITVRGNPLGASEFDFSVGVVKTPFHSGDRLVMFTDGCYEFNIDQKFFGRHRFCKLLNIQAQSPSNKAIESITKKLRDLRKEKYAPDDITMVFIDRK
jgi:hypothetical protein